MPHALQHAPLTHASRNSELQIEPLSWRGRIASSLGLPPSLSPSLRPSRGLLAAHEIAYIIPPQGELEEKDSLIRDLQTEKEIQAGGEIKELSKEVDALSMKWVQVQTLLLNFS